MSKSVPVYQHRFEKFNCCVLIPTFNNDRTLGTLLADLQTYTSNILVVNDGSTDSTADILKTFDLQTITHSENRGKGTALRTGFKFAIESGYDYAITIDSDGQHYPDDLDVFLTELEKQENDDPMLLIGDRNMGRNGIPGKSSKGNRFSNFWFLVVTGIDLHDSQCGYRLYPLQLIRKMKLVTWKFELEIEVPVKAAWRNAIVKNVPVKVLYPETDRVTHFRPFWDIVRIVLLYSWFVLVSFLYIHPRNKYRDFKEKGFNRFWKEDILRSQEPPHQKATAIAIGIFVGLSPFWGIHTFLVFILAALFRVNKITAFVFSNISIPPFIPFILYASYQTGSVLLGNGLDWKLKMSRFQSGIEIISGLGQYIIGSLALAITMAFIVWILFYLLFSVKNQSKVVKP